MLREFDKYRKDGYIDLNQLDTEIEDKNLPPNIHFSFMYQGEKYYVKKREGRAGAIREIVNQSNAVALNMDNAQYDIVKYGSHSVGSVTKSFIKEGSEFQTGKGFLLDNKIIESLSDEKNIYGYIIALLKSGCPIEEVRVKLRIMLERHIMDILSIQTDRHNENFGFLKTSQSTELAPRFDNANSVLYDNDKMLADIETFLKIHAKLADYGFILRYLKGKEDTTGYTYEPWHIRYVGSKKIAKEIMENNLTLEEYLTTQKCLK